MENKNKEPVAVVTVRDTIEAQKKIIDDAHLAIMKEVESIAADYAVIGIPEQKAASIEQYIEPIRAKYSGLLAESALNLGTAVRNQLGALDIFSLKQKIKVMQLKANAVSSLLETMKGVREKLIEKLTWKEFETLKMMLNFFTGVECIGYILAFLSIGDSLALAAIWGILLGVGQTTGIKAIVLWMRDGSGASLSKIAKVIIWVLVVVVATGLGLLRYATVQAAGNDGFAHSTLAPFVFILISYFLISVLALYVWHNYPTTEEQTNMKKAVTLDEEIAVKEAELKQYELEITQLNENCNTVAQVHTLLIQAAMDFYRQYLYDMKEVRILCDVIY